MTGLIECSGGPFDGVEMAIEIPDECFWIDFDARYSYPAIRRQCDAALVKAHRYVYTDRRIQGRIVFDYDRQGPRLYVGEWHAGTS